VAERKRITNIKLLGLSDVPKKSKQKQKQKHPKPFPTDQHPPIIYSIAPPKQSNQIVKASRQQA